MSDDVLDSLARLLAASGYSVEDLVEHHRRATTDERPATLTVARHVDQVLAVLGAGTARGYRTHFVRLVDGVGPQCDCLCETCLDDFVADAVCHDRGGHCAKRLSFAPAGDKVLREGCIGRNELEVLAVIAERMSAKKAAIDNRGRARRGLSAKTAHGQGGREMCVAALRCLFDRAIPEHLRTNPAEKIKKGNRSETRRRALTDDELAELLDETVGAGDDPEGDLALVWTALETGARRGGIVSATVGALNTELSTIRLLEKGKKEREQPISSDLAEYLLALAVERGGSRCLRGHSDFDPNAALFYFADSTPSAPHPLTTRRFDTLNGRLQRALPWANDMMFSGHVLRHTSGTIIERVAGTQVARKFLGHGKRRTTDTYTDASETEVATAFSKMTGQDHPKARR
jgi:integrase